MSNSRPSTRLSPTVGVVDHALLDPVYARRVGAELLAMADPHCRRCGHRALAHGWESRPRNAWWGWFDHEDPLPCQFRGDRPCSCPSWDPEDVTGDPHQAFGMVRVRDLWFEVPLGSGWLAAYRVAAEAGHSIISELRVFPNERHRPGAGRWSAEALGAAAKGVPRGGITARLLRQVPVGSRLHYARRVLHGLAREAPDLLPTPWDAEVVRRPKGPGGRKGRPPSELASVAAAYAQALTRGSKSPAKDVALSMGLSGPKVRSILLRARRVGILSRAEGQGKRGGRLTERGRKVLRASRRRSTRRKGGPE